MPLRENPGYLPDDCIIRNENGEVTGYRRIRAVCFGGYDTARKEPAGWASGDRGACSWTISRKPHPFEIKEYEVL